MWPEAAPRLDLAALLGRPEQATGLEAAGEALRGRRVLVTGAAGSVGSALAEALAGLAPAALYLLDHHEHTLFGLARSFAATGRTAEVVLADVRDRRRMERLFRAARPEVVFHLAAYKHVPFGERFPEQTVATNVLATRDLLELAAEFDVVSFAYPSSDKSVNPPSLYGATKRLGEALVRRQAALTGQRFAVARYVNILGTRGSVIETFAAQLLAGQPLTLTDPRMTRYWMTMAEAVWLICQVAALAPPGAVWLLDGLCERPVAETARDLARLLRPEQTDYPVRTTGARPGERLREELLSAREAAAPGPRPGLLAVERPGGDCLESVAEHVAEIEALYQAGEAAALRRATMAAAEQLQ